MNSFDVNSTVIFPILGGVIAGFIVVVVEFVVRNCHSRWQQDKAINTLGNLFSKWESRINDAVELLDDQGRVYRNRGVVQILHHQYYLKRVPLALAAWSKNLSEKQTDELTTLIFEQEQILSIVPKDKVLLQEVYDGFFRKAREIEWLKFRRVI